MAALTVGTGAFLLAGLFVAAASREAEAQTAPATQSSPSSGLKLWVAGGSGFATARAGCFTCDRAGVFTSTRSLLVDAGVRINQKVDAGVELLWVSARLEEGSDPVWTTFILGIAQLRPWETRGFFVKAGMGIGFAGNGIYSPIGPPLAPPFTTNALALAYGTGWVFRREHRYAVQVHGLHHVVALGELTTVAGTSIKNVVGNYWTLGAALVVRQ